MPLPLATIVDPQLFQSGIYRSVDKMKAPLFVDGSNVDFRRGQVEKARGYAALGTASVAVNALAAGLVSGTKRAYLGTTTALYWMSSAGASTTIRTGLSSGRWSLLPWGAFLIATNDVDRVQLWQNTGTAADISDGPTRARIVRALNVFAVAFDADGIAGRWEWCDRGNPTLWTPALDNLAGGDNIRNIASKIMAAEQFGNGLASWSDRQMYLHTFVGGTTVLSYQTLPAAVGAAGLNAVCVSGPYAYGLESRGFWRTDGYNIEWLADPMVWDYYKDRIDFSLGDYITCHYNGERQTVEWHWPIVSSGGNEGVVYSVQDRSWSPRDWGLTASCGDAVFGKPLGANGTSVYTLDTGVNKAGSAMTSYVQTKPMAFDALNQFKWIDEFRNRMSGNASIYLGLHYSSPDTVDTWLSPQTFAQRIYPPATYNEALFWSLKISSTAADVDWSWAGTEVYGQLCGELI